MLGDSVAGFPLIEVESVVRRTLRSCAVVAVIGVAAAIEFGQPLVAPGLVIGMFLGVGNHRLFQLSATRYTTTEGRVQRRPFASATVARLAASTAVAVALLVFVRPMGWGVVGGLAAFQLLLLVNAMVALVQYQRHQGSGGDA